MDSWASQENTIKLRWPFTSTETEVFPLLEREVVEGPLHSLSRTSVNLVLENRSCGVKMVLQSIVKATLIDKWTHTRD